MKDFHKCPKCKDLISKFAISRHLKSCKGINKNLRNTNSSKEKLEKISVQIGDNLFECKKCKKQYSKLGIKTHYFRNHTKKGKLVKSFLNKIPWNKGLTLETDNRILKASNKVKEGYKSGRIINALKNKKLSFKTKKKISVSQKIAAFEGRNKGWFHTYSDPNKRSYPEKYFEEVFKNLKLYDKYNIIHNFHYKKYFLDFAIIDLKIDIEVDGSQHLKIENIKHDKIRTKILNKEGWKVYRISWIKFKNSSEKDKQKELKNLLKFIKDNILNYNFSYCENNDVF